MTMGIAGVLLVVWAIALFVMYHKIFTVFYFDLTRGIGKEIMWCLIGSCILTALTIYFYWVIAIVVAIAGVVLSFKTEDTTKKIYIIVAFIVLAVVVGLIGRNTKKELMGEDSSEESYDESYDNTDYGVNSNTSDNSQFYDSSYVDTSDDENVDYYEDYSYEQDEYNTDSYSEEQFDETVYEEPETSSTEDNNSFVYVIDGEETDNYWTLFESEIFVRELTEEDLYGFTAKELTYLRNNVYARHGYIFNSQELTEYYSQYSEYVQNPDFSVEEFSSVEKHNVDFIRDYQNSNNLMYSPQ